MRNVPALSIWKSVGLGLILAATPAAPFVHAEPTDAESLHQQAVLQYIEGAARELEAYGQQIASAARADNKQQCADARAKLEQCKALVADLRAADTEHFDLIKADYERARGELVKAVEAAQGK